MDNLDVFKSEISVKILTNYSEISHSELSKNIWLKISG